MNIDDKELLELAAQKLADKHYSEEDIDNHIKTIIEHRVQEQFSKDLKSVVGGFIEAEMEKLIAKDIVPVDIWGEKAGEPTNIRAELHKRALEFWSVKVNEEGKEERSWGGVPRHEWLLRRVAKDEFMKAMQENAELIISGFKAALTADAKELVAKHINNLIKVK